MAEDGWDLEAVVRGCLGAAKSTVETDPFSLLNVVVMKEEDEEEDDGLRFLSEVFSTQRGVVHELEELCKPFFTRSSEQQQQTQQLSPERKTSSMTLQHQIRQPQARSFTQTPRAKRRYSRLFCPIENLLGSFSPQKFSELDS